MKRILHVFVALLVVQGFSAAQNAAHRRAERLGNGMNLTFLDNYWKGSKEKRYSDFLKTGELPARKEMLRDIANSGYKTVRIPVCFSAWASFEKPYKWTVPEGLAATDKMVKWALENGLNVIIDMHHPELDRSIPNAGNIDRMVWMWNQVALRYKETDPDRVLFELWNEPHDIKASLWRSHAKTLIKTVRKVAPDHTFVVGFHDWNSRQAMIESKPFDDKNIIYTFHFYDPFLFTHQGTTWSAEGLADIKGIPYPYDQSVSMTVPASAKGKWSGGLIGTYKTDSSKEKMFEDLKTAKKWSEKHRVPIFLGEFGSFSKFATIESRCRHFEVLYSAFRKLKIPNAAWEWNDSFNMFKKGTTEILPCVRKAAGLKKTGEWKLSWSDEFEGSSGTGVDSKKWKHDIGGEGWGNKEFQYYTDSTKNSFHNGSGHLVIKAIKEGSPKSTKCWYGKCRYTSARLLTKNTFTQKYGRFEARIKVPYGQGIWPAFWLLGDDIDKVGWPKCGEIDVMENIGREPSMAHGTVHGPGYAGNMGIGKEYSLKDGKRFTEDFHVFAVEWEPEVIRWYIDGELYHTLRPNDLPKGAKWVFDHPHFMLLNLAVGGNWPGSPDETTVFPQVMKIDYVRVYEKY